MHLNIYIIYIYIKPHDRTQKLRGIFGVYKNPVSGEYHEVLN